MRVGVDLGGTNIAVGLVELDGTLHAKLSVLTGAERPASEVIGSIASAVRSLLERESVPLAAIESVGVGVPGTCDQKAGLVRFATNLFWEDVPLTEKLSALLNVPVRFDNDANCAALGEMAVGGGKGFDSLILITLGTGVGGGVILGGKLFSGCEGMGTEVGHMVIGQDGPQCNCGRRGCFEMYASSTALVRQTKKEMAENPLSGLERYMKPGKGKVSGRTAFLAARDGNEAGLRIVRRYIEYLACGITNLVNIFMPQAVLLGGGISGEGEYLLAPLRKLVKQDVYGGERAPDVKILKATLGNDAGIIGAALL